MIKLIKGDRVIKASEKAYRYLYKARGYKPFNPAKNGPVEADNTQVGINDYQSMTKAEIGKVLTARGIDFNPRDRKEKLIELLAEGD